MIPLGLAMAGTILAFVFGATIGALAMAATAVASDADRRSGVK